MRPISIKKFRIRIVGDTPLITHAWDEKAKRMMLESQTKKKSKTEKHDTKFPFDDFARSLHWITEMPTETITDPSTNKKREVVTEELFEKAVTEGARFGFPANSFKMSGNAAAYRLGWVPNQMELRGSYFINAEDGSDLLEIKGCQPMMREDMVKVKGSADIRYRPIFENWYCDAEIEYNASGNMKIDDILNCLNAGGYCVGVGEWRPERDGRFGKFHIEMVK